MPRNMSLADEDQTVAESIIQPYPNLVAADADPGDHAHRLVAELRRRRRPEDAFSARLRARSPGRNPAIIPDLAVLRLERRGRCQNQQCRGQGYGDGEARPEREPGSRRMTPGRRT